MTSSPAGPAPAEPALSVPAESLLQELDDAAALLGPEGTVHAVNQALEQVLGRQREELVGLPGHGWEAILAEVFPGQAGPISPGTLERAGYPRQYFRYSRRPVTAPGGSAAFRLDLFRNVTESVRAREDRERADTRHAREIAGLEARLELAEKFKMELTANVTHDLRTPLASIKASVSGLLAGDVAYDPATVRETLSVIEEEADRLQRRVQNLLSMARMEAGDAVWSRDWVDIADVAASALESLRSVRGDRPILVSFPDDLPLVYADYDQILIAIRNLLENAFLYTPADQPVEVSANTGMGQVRIRVRDRGPGLMPDEAERVFEKFYRGRAARRIPGTGLGLPICRAIAEAHGGRLWVEHAPGGGAAFVFSLPHQGEDGLEVSPEVDATTDGEQADSRETPDGQ